MANIVEGLFYGLLEFLKGLMDNIRRKNYTKKHEKDLDDLKKAKPVGEKEQIDDAKKIQDIITNNK